MKKLLSDQNICEVHLTIYFSNYQEICLGSKLIEALDDFIDFYRAEDKFNNTQNVELIEKIYGNHEFQTRNDFLKFINFSETALFRYRAKIVDRLETHLQSCFMENQNFIKPNTAVMR